MVVPAAVAAAIGGTKGALSGRGLTRLSGAARGAGSAVASTFGRAGRPALIAGGGLGGLGAISQYDLGTGLAELAAEKSASVAQRLLKISQLLKGA